MIFNQVSDCSKEWVSDCCLTPTQQFFSYIMTGTSYFQWDDCSNDFEINKVYNLRVKLCYM
jgi:hypothetical protein